MRRILVLCLCLCWPMLALAQHHHRDGAPTRGLREVTVLIVRHAEKVQGSHGLSPAGQARARAYARYFAPLVLDGRSVWPQRLIATRDSRSSARPRLTLTPLSQRLGLPIEQPFANKQTAALVASLRQDNRAGVVLIAWHHGHIGKLIEDFGGDAKALLGDEWPDSTYDWLIVLRFDAQGRLIPGDSRRLVEPTWVGGT